MDMCPLNASRHCAKYFLRILSLTDRILPTTLPSTQHYSLCHTDQEPEVQNLPSLTPGHTVSRCFRDAGLAAPGQTLLDVCFCIFQYVVSNLKLGA